MARTKIERFGKDAKGQLCSEGYYVITPQGELILMPPTALFDEAKGFRFADHDEVFTPRPARAAHLGEIVVPPEPEATSPASANSSS